MNPTAISSSSPAEFTPVSSAVSRLRSPRGFLWWIVILALYFCHSFFSLPSQVGQMCLGLLLGLGAVWAVVMLVRHPGVPYFYVGVCLLVTTWMIWLQSPEMVYSPNLGAMQTSVMVKNMSLTLLMLPAGMWIGRRCAPSPGQCLAATFIVMATAGVHFIICAQSLDALNVKAENYANNGAYCFISVLPFFTLTWRRYPRVSLLLGLICIGFIVCSGKRGAVVCLLLLLLSTTLFLMKIRPKWRLRILAVASLLGVASACLGVWVYDSEPFVHDRVMATVDGYTSGRDELYPTLWHYFQQEEDVVSVLTGHGVMYTVELTGNYAHCDWLELLIDTGLLGAVLYLEFYLSFLYFILRTHGRLGASLEFQLSLIVGLLAVESIFSMGIIAIFNSFDTFLLGILTAQALLRLRSYRRPLPALHLHPHRLRP